MSDKTFKVSELQAVQSLDDDDLLLVSDFTDGKNPRTRNLNISSLANKIRDGLETTAAVDEKLQTKADISAVTEVDEKLQVKADISAVTEVDEKLQVKADISAVTEVDEKLQAKADISAVVDVANDLTDLSNSLSDYYAKSGTSSVVELNAKFETKADLTALNNVVDSLSDYYTKNETSSATEVDEKLQAKADISAVTDLATNIDLKSTVSVDNIKSDINIVKISFDEYAKLVDENAVLRNNIYILSGDNFNLFNEKIVNLAPGINPFDAVNMSQLSALKEYIDLKIAEVRN